MQAHGSAKQDILLLMALMVLMGIRVEGHRIERWMKAHENPSLRVAQSSGRTIDYLRADATLTCSGPIALWSPREVDVIKEDGQRNGYRSGNYFKLQAGHYRIRPRDTRWGKEWMNLTVNF